MTKYYQYDTTISNAKRKLNAAFVHELKKMCGRKFHYHVTEIFYDPIDQDDSLGDYVYVKYDNNNKEFKSCLRGLLARYCIGREYVKHFQSFEKGEYFVNIYLSQSPDE